MDGGDDPHSVGRAGVDCDRPHRHAPRHELAGACWCRKPSSATRTAAISIVFRGKSGKLIKILWHDGLGMSLYAKRLERGRFIWPSPADGAVTITPAQLGYLLEGHRLADAATHLATAGGWLIAGDLN